MKRRSFLKGLAALSAAPFLPQIALAKEEAIPTVIGTNAKKILPQVLVYFNGVFQAENKDYTFSKTGEGTYRIDWAEPIADSVMPTIVVNPQDKGNLVFVSNINSTGATIYERCVHSGA